MGNRFRKAWSVSRAKELPEETPSYVDVSPGPISLSLVCSSGWACLEDSNHLISSLCGDSQAPGNPVPAVKHMGAELECPICFATLPGRCDRHALRQPLR